MKFEELSLEAMVKAFMNYSDDEISKHEYWNKDGTMGVGIGGWMIESTDLPIPNANIVGFIKST